MARLLIVFFICVASVARGQADRPLIVPFYGREAALPVSAASLPSFSGSHHDLQFIRYRQQLDQAGLQALSEKLQQYRQQWQLNDWLYYELVSQTARQWLSRPDNASRELVIWALLSNAGYNTSLTFTARSVYAAVQSAEKVFDASYWQFEGLHFLQLASMAGEKTERDCYMSKLRLNPAGRPFRFELSGLPQLPPAPEARTVRFRHEGKAFQVSFQVDKQVLRFQHNYPSLDYRSYFQVPLSETARATLLPQLQAYTQGKSEAETVRFLLSFVRSGFRYAKDEEIFGGEHPLTAEETLYYAYSDCEDRAALFSQLVRELTGLPTLALDYHDHISVAVQFNELRSYSFEYQERPFTICEPTNSSDSLQLGEMPDEYLKKEFVVIASFGL